MAGVIAVATAGRRWLKGHKWGWTGSQGSDHLHDIGHHHVGGAHGAAALQHGAVRLLLDVNVGLDGHWLPAARRVDGDLLIIGAGQGDRRGRSGEKLKEVAKAKGT